MLSFLHVQNTKYDMSDSRTTKAVVSSISLVAPGSITIPSLQPPSSKRLCPIRLAKSCGVSPRSLATNSLGLQKDEKIDQLQMFLGKVQRFQNTWCLSLCWKMGVQVFGASRCQGIFWRGHLVYLDVSSQNQLARVGILIA